MSRFIISGGKPLRGSVRLGGAKNASFKLMIASLLCDTESRILNIPDITDVHLTKKLMETLGAKVVDCGERIYCIDPHAINNWEIPSEHGESSRASSLFAAPLLARFGKAVFPLPGGDKLGTRPIDRHLLGLETLGVKVNAVGEKVELSCSKLMGGHFKFAKNSHTGTETLIMAAVKATGKTVLENAAEEPEVDDLIKFLNNCGAKIQRAGRTINIEGVSSLKGSIHKVMPDRNEAVTYACAALGTKGDIIIENADPKHLQVFLNKVREIGGSYDVADYGIRVWYQKPLHAAKVTTAPHPGFMTDWQPLWTTLMTQAMGESEVVETVYPNRLGFTDSLRAMGAHIELFNPDIADKDSFYNFNLDTDKPEYYHAARISGPARLSPVNTTVTDIRHGATLVLASLIAEGESTLDNVEMVDRGYENLDLRLRRLGAEIVQKV